MDDKKKDPPALPFYQYSLFPAGKEPMRYCMLANFAPAPGSVPVGDQAKVYAKSRNIEEIAKRIQYRESGLSDRNFQELVSQQLDGPLQSGMVRHMEFVDDGCIIFEADPALLEQLRENFPTSKFAFHALKDYIERDRLIRNYFDIRRNSMEDRDLVKSRPYLDS